MTSTIEQTFEPIPTEALLDRVGGLHKAGYRLVQIGATRLPEAVELTYSFDRELSLVNLRLQVPATAARVPSITSIYWGAFLYENELHDLFNVQVDGMAVDFHGHLYETAVKFPFGSTKVPVVAAPAAGVRPSPGAAMSASGAGGESPKTRSQAKLAAPEDGRTPVAAAAPTATPAAKP
jgi:ech hydrogenase subunit D